ncbi:MAG: glutamate 5-kinase [Oscillospiraceae bacterium]|jgi:glutamate 5-kinase|nr:glutamate 5-kinase [Oscillospiraceae bacterium]
MEYKRIVVKVGTSTLTHSTGRLHIERLDKLARVLSDLKNGGREVLLVTSGAIGAGAAALNFEKPDTVSGKQAAAAVGQCRLMHIYDKLFAEYGHTVAQILVARHDLTVPDRGGLLLDTLQTLLSWRTVPVVNENDAVSHAEIAPGQNGHATFGDNDTLSALIAALVKADLLVLLTDIDGFYTADPRENPDARRIKRVTDVTDKMRLASGGAGTARGTGGMITKLAAAEIALENGFPMAVAHGKDPAVLYEILRGGDVGTLFARS